MLTPRAMIFTTYWFLWFALVAVGVFRLLPPGAGRLAWLAAGCVVFHYHFAGPAGVAPIIVLMVITYLAARTRVRACCTAAIVVAVAALCFYKYTAFLAGSFVAWISPTAAAAMNSRATALLPTAPPLGISFFTFEFVHYLLEVRRGGEPIRSPLRFLLFSIFFPSLVAGPIKRYPQFLPSLELAAGTASRRNDLAEGLYRMGLGFAKKLLVADQLTIFIDRWQPHFAEEGLWGRWIVLLAISFRILFDFSGYSDIAIGCALTLGIRLPENFDWPYAARNLQAFWQRWHMSLTSWIRDYIYIPLGGSRHGLARRVLSGMVAFALCGLWHGPAWHYVLWGLYHGVGLVVCFSYARLPVVGPAVGGIIAKEPMVGFGLTFLFVALGWLLFFYPVDVAWQMTRELFGQ